jgi:GTP-binding protein HflX
MWLLLRSGRKTLEGVKTVLVERRLSNEKSLLSELKSLAEAAGYEVVSVFQQLREPDSRYQIGRGKAEELAKLVKEVGAEKIIFENELKPVQVYNLAKMTGIEVIDKFDLILEVFFRHASTSEAKLQIELAKLHYELIRAKQKVRLAKMGEQPGFYGLGRYEVDVYYEAIKRRISHIRSELKEIRAKRGIKRAVRREWGFPTVSLAGYTVSGKSTLFNMLTGGGAKVGDGFFTTLSPKTSVVDFCGKRALIIDTVGFIDGLPITLIEAFRSTFEETIFSDLIILVVDCSEEISEISRKLDCCMGILRDIGAVRIPIITAFNKIDLIDDLKIQNIISSLRGRAPNPIAISALKGTNLDKLKQTVAEKLRDFVKALFRLPLNSNSIALISKVRKQSKVLNQNYDGENVFVTIESMDYLMEKIKTQIENVGGELVYAEQV